MKKIILFFVLIIVTSLNHADYHIKVFLDNSSIKLGEETASPVITENSVINSFVSNKLNFTLGESLIFNWDISNAGDLELTPYGVVSGNSQTINLGSIGDFTYNIRSENQDGSYTTSNPILISVYDYPFVDNVSAPTNVFSNTPVERLLISWDGKPAQNYSIRSNNINSSISTTDFNIGDVNSYFINETNIGSYVYTITGTNGAGQSISTNSNQVIVEANPEINSFTASPTNVNANGTVTLSWNATNIGTLSINQSVGVVSGNSINVNVGSTTGSKTYTLTNTKTLNGVTRSDTRNVSITVNAVETCLYSNGNYITDNDGGYFIGYYGGSRVFTNISDAQVRSGYTVGGYTYRMGAQGSYENYSMAHGLTGQEYAICRR